MPFSKKLEKIKAMLPLYSKRLVSDEKREEVENFLSNETALQRELNFWNSVKEGYEKIKKDLPEPPTHIYSKIVDNIEKTKREKTGFFNMFRLNPKFSFSLIVAEFLLIIGLILYILNLKYEYKTLSLTEIRAETAITLNVVFKENATERDIRELLTKIDGRIIDGPSKTGLYVIGIKDKENKDKALDFLRKSNIVLFAEPAI